MPRLYVPLAPRDFDRLLELAADARRRPQDEAALMIERALRRRAVAKTKPPGTPQASGSPSAAAADDFAGGAA